MRFRFRWHFGL